MTVDLLFEVRLATVIDFSLILLKIFCNTCSSVNSALSSLIKVHPMLVETFC